jgi:hypothetical protein
MNTTPAPTSHRGFTRGLFALAFVGAFLIWSTPVPAQGVPDRLSDKAVADLIDQIEPAREKFEDSLSDDVRTTVLRSPTGEVKVEAYLDDLKENIKKFKERFTADYAASSELETVLKQCNAIDTFMYKTPDTKGRSEWELLAKTLKSVAAVYGATFPLATGTPVRRMNDRETAEAIGSLEAAADKFKGAIGDDKAVLKADQDAGKKLADDLRESAKQLKSRVADGKPATVEAKTVLQQASLLDAFAQRHPTLRSAASFTGINAALGKIRQSFGVR